ncbi:right-handed parallel beta-helix repeat-containing protein [Bacillus rhizoplanae]|uniref:right-handed parallel beta-helix repeat-containing protein n=1 Tax=Bacillus rhizoplanae TaxID=2880966 RepID=UPI003D1A871C
MAIWTVYPPGSIQNAVNKAAPGDVILVHNGEYNEQVTVDKDHLRIIAVGDRVVLDGEFNLDFAFDLTADGVEIRGFKIKKYNIFGILTQSNFNRIIGNEITEIHGYGISLGSDGNLSYKNDISCTDFSAIVISHSNGNWIVKNKLHNSFQGVSVLSRGGGFGPPQNNAIIGNFIAKNEQGGISNEAFQNLLVLENQVEENGTVGSFHGSDNSVDLCNAYKDNIGTGIDIRANNVFIGDDSIKRNTDRGIHVIVVSTFNVIQNNEVEENQNNGIELDSTTTQNTVNNNELEDNHPKNIADFDTNNIFHNNIEEDESSD